MKTADSAGDRDKPAIAFKKPPLPLVWLDTWVFIRIAKAQAGELIGEEAKELRHLFELLVALRDRKRVITPETGHDLEVEAGGHLLTETRRVMSQVTLGVQTHFDIARDAQMYAGMKAFVTGATTVDLNWRDAFLDDPLEELNHEGPLIRVNLGHSTDELKDVARANSELARQLEALRQECLKQRQTFEQRLEIEMRGVVEATQECANDLEPRIRRGDIPAVDDFLRWLQVLSDPRAVLSHYKEDATGQAATTENLLEFYRSPYYGKLPAERIRAELYAIKLTGTEVIKPSDRMDMHQVAALLPFARVMILDGSMTDKVRRLKLEERFGATVVAHVHELIQVLETL